MALYTVQVACRPEVFCLAYLHGEMDTRSYRARGITATSGWRPCPMPRPLSVYNPYIPKALPPKQRHSSAPARGQSLSETRWTSATSTTARRAAGGRPPRSCLSCDWWGTGEGRPGREGLYCATRRSLPGGGHAGVARLDCVVLS